MKMQGGWLLAFTLLVSCHGVAMAQETTNIRYWLTTPDRSALLAEQKEPLHFSSSANESPTIDVNDMQQFQSIDGFGFALTGGSAQLLMRMDPGSRADLLKNLFASDGSAVSYLRLTIGSSDMNERVYSYDDLPPGETDQNLTHFSLGPDRADVIPIMKQILAIHPAIQILGSPWSAPAWMKTNGRVKDGHLKPEYYGAYAAYFVKYIQQMKAEGISIAAVTIQNEPLNPKNTPSMVVFAPEEAAFIAKALAPALHEARLHTKIWVYDHNPDVPSYPLDILADPAASPDVDGTAFHLYGGTAATFTEVHDLYPRKNMYMTEQSITSEPGSMPIAESLTRVPIDSTRNWSKNVMLWNLAADPNNGPHTNDGGCTGCRGAVTIDGNQVSRNLAYYADAHFSKFVPPGSVHVGSNEEEQLATVAFHTPDGHTVLVVSNTGNFPKQFNVKYHGQWFATSMPAESAGTYVW